MSLEQTINYQLNKYPKAKRTVKFVYQHVMYAISPKIRYEGNITRVSPNDGSHEYFFGYYDKSPWDITDRYVLCLRANDTWSDVSPKEKADILLIDTVLPEDNGSRVRKLAETSAWNVQQSCMLQWLGPDFSSQIIYNDCRSGKYVSVIQHVASGEERVVTAPVYTVSTDGKTALTLDFSRLYNLRPGYGYHNVPETTEGIAFPKATAIWKIDLVTGVVSPLLSYEDFVSLQPREEMLDVSAVHKVNHLMISPSGNRCMVLYRWFNGRRKYTRLITFNTEDGKDMYVLSDDNMVSHCFWKDDEHILAFENKKDCGPGYYMMTDKTQIFSRCWPKLCNDGHPSYSPDRKHVVTDTYPDRMRMAEIKIMDGVDEQKDGAEVVARVFAPFKYDNDTRCDLHPRWNRAGDRIAFDSVFEGHRGLYVVKPELPLPIIMNKDSCETSLVDKRPVISIIVPVYNVEKYLQKCIESIKNQTYHNLEIILVDDGSTDASGEICDQLGADNSRIKVIHRDNGGLSAARNTGMSVATGAYVGFVDSDDWVAPDMYEHLYYMTEVAGAEVTQVGYFAAYDESLESDPLTKDIKTYRGKEILQQYLYEGMSQTGAYSVCRCLFKRSVLTGLSFREGKVNEDIDFKYRALSACGCFSESSRRLYYYRQRIGSTTNDGLQRKDFDLYDAALELCELVENERYSAIRRLVLEKMARTPFSLLSKVAYYGITDKSLNEAGVVKMLQQEVRHALPILVRSPMPLNRKVLAVLYSLNFELSERCVHLIKRIGA